ncbi:MAG: hypothetical protein II515_04760 [Desulfovibrio sp.]|nr:hypothetical protein [Desulfovibrio sp.]
MPSEGKRRRAFAPATGILRTAGGAMLACAPEGKRPAVFPAVQGTTGTSPGEGLLLPDFPASPQGQAFFAASGFGLPEARP